MKLVTLIACLSWSVVASAHALWDPNGSTPGRTTTILKSGPCGGIARTNTPQVFSPGQTITVNWLETIQHPGKFQISFSPAGDANFTMLKEVTDDQNGTNDLPHKFSTTVTLPSTPCTDCTLQLIQVMTENNPPSYYYACADIQIKSAVVQPPPNPTPSPNPNCNP